MTRRHVRGAIVLWSLAAFMLGACATGAPKMSAEQAIADRQRLMKLQGASMQDLQAKLKAGNIEAVAVNADTLVFTSQYIAGLFPEGSLSDKSRAKPAIWEKRSEFEGYANSLQTQAMKVADLARKKDQAGTQAAVAEMGRTTCGPCHDAFRAPSRSAASATRRGP
jgi:cytochrome c556